MYKSELIVFLQRSTQTKSCNPMLICMQIIPVNTTAQEGITNTSKAHHHPRLRLQQIWALCPQRSQPAPH